MKIKVYGFKFDAKIFPKAMQVTDVFEYMQKTAGASSGKLYRFGTEKISTPQDNPEKEWWGGMVLKIRNSSAFTKLTEADGKAILTAETLEDNERLVELTYFVAHPKTGSGLLAHHYHGTSLAAFSAGCRRAFVRAKREALTEACKDKLAKEIREIHKDFKGKLNLDQLCMDTDLKTLVKQLKRVSTFELRLTTLETQEKFLRGVIEKAKHETIKIAFPPDLDVDELADDAFGLSEMDTVSEIKVSGYDEKNIHHAFFKGQNPLVFFEFDYDDVMKGLQLDLNDWATSIQDSNMIKKLVAVASGKSTHKLLSLA